MSDPGRGVLSSRPPSPTPPAEVLSVEISTRSIILALYAASDETPWGGVGEGPRAGVVILEL
jgi:hypothetical protein